MPTEPNGNGAYRWTSGRLMAGGLVVAGGLALVLVLWVRSGVAPSFEALSTLDLFGNGDYRYGVPDGQFDVTHLLVDEDDFRSGGPEKDGIFALTTSAVRGEAQRDPSLDGYRQPTIKPVGEASYPRPEDRVLGLTVHGESRAYPLAVLSYHEVVNDVLGGVPIAVIYCPLCDSVSVVDRRLDGRVYEFGISGLLYNSNLVLYDRTDQALWTQVRMRAVSGPNAGRSLQHLDGWELSQFAAWAERHADGTVLTFDTGHGRPNYRFDPYERYFSNDVVFFPLSSKNEHMPAKTPVVGIALADASGATPLAPAARAYPLSAIHAGGVVRDELGGQPVVLESFDNGRGVRVTKAPEGAQVVHTFWFAWAAFWPQTDVYEPPAGYHAGSAEGLLLRELDRVLKEGGYERTGPLSWHREHERAWTAVRLYKQDYRDNFVLRIGLYLKALGPARRPLESECHARTTLGMLSSDEQRIRELMDFDRPGLPDEQRVAEICRVAKDEALGWLEMHSDPQRLRAFASQPDYREKAYLSPKAMRHLSERSAELGDGGAVGHALR